MSNRVHTVQTPNGVDSERLYGNHNMKMISIIKILLHEGFQFF